MNASHEPTKPVEGEAALSVEDATRMIGQVAGELSLALMRRFIRPSQAKNMVQRLRQAADALERRFLT